MLARIVEASLRYKYLVIFATLFVIVLGIRALTTIPIDAFPDVSPVQVQVFTESAGLSPEEVEKLITVPVESSMAGLPKVGAGNKSVGGQFLVRNREEYLVRGTAPGAVPEGGGPADTAGGQAGGGGRCVRSRRSSG